MTDEQQTQAPPEPPRTPRKKRTVAQRKASLKVKTVHPHDIICYPQENLRIKAGTITELAADDWVRRQIELGTLTEV